LYDAAPSDVQPILDQIGSLVEHARQAIEIGDVRALGAFMNANHTLLQRLTVSSHELDQLVQVALDAGALGAKLSGGGRGGNMIALVTPRAADAVQAALLQAGAVRVTMTTLGVKDS
jgi:mevalonate kinase